MKEASSTILKILNIIIYSSLVVKSLFSYRKSVCIADYKIIRQLIADFEAKHPLLSNSQFLKFKAEMKLARKYKNNNLPQNIVKLNSTVMIKNTQTTMILPLQIVNPSEEELNKYKLSIFSSIGMSLFGSKKGRTIVCFKKYRNIKLEIVNIV